MCVTIIMAVIVVAVMILLLLLLLLLLFCIDGIGLHLYKNALKQIRS